MEIVNFIYEKHVFYFAWTSIKKHFIIRDLGQTSIAQKCCKHLQVLQKNVLMTYRHVTFVIVFSQVFSKEKAAFY